MRRSDSIKEISTALTAFQKDAPKIGKDKTATVPTKSGTSYKYDYADLASIWDKIRGALADNGLSVVQMPTSQTGEPCLTTMIAHTSGEWLEDTMRLTIVQDTPQGQGSAITYARRYALCAALGIVADSDTDAQDHKTLSQPQKQKLYQTAKNIMPELGEDPLAMVRFITEVVGKHPSRILETEFEDAIGNIETYTSKEAAA